MGQDLVHGTGGWVERMLTALRPVAQARAKREAANLAAWQQSVETHLTALQAAHDADEQLRAAIVETTRQLAADTRGLAGWQQSATAHLAGLQAGYEAIAGRLASMSHNTPPSGIEWIRAAETHLGGLQAEIERFRTLLQRHEHGLASLQTGLSQLERRAIDLESADTEIALALAREPADRARR
jgi:hypothetical protein